MSTIIEYLGGPAFRIIASSGISILIDPYLADEVGSIIKPNEIKQLDLLLLTHGGRTHIGDSIDILKRTGAKLVCGSEVRLWAESYGIPSEQIALTTWGVKFTLCGINIQTVEAHHPSHIKDKQGNFLTGMTHGYIIEVDSHKIYHMGDTSIFGDLKTIGMLYKPSIGLVPVGAGTRSFYAELSPAEAALACNWINIKTAIPMHYMPGSGDELTFESACLEKAPDVKVVKLNPGEKLTL